MSGDVKEGKLNMHASLIREKIHEKVIGAKKPASDQDSVTYCEAIFLITDKKIKQINIIENKKFMKTNQYNDLRKEYQSKDQVKFQEI